MFEPFQRLGDHDTATGIGLGLAVARGFTEVMTGTLAASETPGGGLTMTVTLPTASDPAKADAPGGEPTVHPDMTTCSARRAGGPGRAARVLRAVGSPP